MGCNPSLCKKTFSESYISIYAIWKNHNCYLIILGKYKLMNEWMFLFKRQNFLRQKYCLFDKNEVWVVIVK